MALFSLFCVDTVAKLNSSKSALFSFGESVKLTVFSNNESAAGQLYGLQPKDIFNMHFLGHILLYISGLILTYTLWSVAFSPLDRVKSVSDVGWSFLNKSPNKSNWYWRLLSTLGMSSRWNQSSRELAASIRRQQKLRRCGTLPPVYPNGWFAIVESRNLSRGQVSSVEVLGQNLAVFRSEVGKARVVDAYCPHLGANMAAGGMVRGDCIECPFHGWQFSGQDGSCTTIPYAAKIPNVAKVRSWDVRELNGFIFIWHDAEGRPPQWQLPEVPEVMSGYWRYRGRTQHEVLAHVQDIPENGADIAHLGHLHVPSVFKGADLGTVFSDNKVHDVAQHEWSGIWRPAEGDGNGHLAEVSIEHAFSLCAGTIKLFKMAVEAKQIGPGLVHLHLNTSLGKGVLIQTVTPLGPLQQRVSHHFYSSPSFIAPFAKFVLHSEACHLERDIMIWNCKQYMQRPLLVSEDKLIKSFRTWYKQFYSQNSPTIQTVQKSDMEW